MATKPIVPELITGKNGLNYCCLWAFFTLYRSSDAIALRLGVTTRTVRLYKERFHAGEFKCEGCEKCLKPHMKMLKA